MSAEPVCDVCAGSGMPLSGKPCICGGTGYSHDEKIGLRRKVHELELQISDLESVNADYLQVCKQRDNALRIGDEMLQSMNDLYSFLSLVRHRHLDPKLNLEKEIDPVLSRADKYLNPWWKKQRQQPDKRHQASEKHGIGDYPMFKDETAAEMDRLKAERDALKLQNRQLIENGGRQADETLKIFNENEQLKRLVSGIASAWKEQKAAVEANVPSGEFGEDDLRAERVSLAKKRLERALDEIGKAEGKVPQ